MRAHGALHLAGVEAAAQQPEGRSASAELARGSREQLAVLAETLAHEPEQVVDDALLPARRAVSVVQKENHPRESLVRKRRAQLRKALQT
jgi:hypothetical protein